MLEYNQSEVPSFSVLVRLKIYTSIQSDWVILHLNLIKKNTCSWVLRFQILSIGIRGLVAHQFDLIQIEFSQIAVFVESREYILVIRSSLWRISEIQSERITVTTINRVSWSIWRSISIIRYSIDQAFEEFWSISFKISFHQFEVQVQIWSIWRLIFVFQWSSV